MTFTVFPVPVGPTINKCFYKSTFIEIMKLFLIESIVWIISSWHKWSVLFLVFRWSDEFACPANWPNFVLYVGNRHCTCFGSWSHWTWSYVSLVLSSLSGYEFHRHCCLWWEKWWIHGIKVELHLLELPRKTIYRRKWCYFGKIPRMLPGFSPLH